MIIFFLVLVYVIVRILKKNNIPGIISIIRDNNDSEYEDTSYNRSKTFETNLPQPVTNLSEKVTDLIAKDPVFNIQIFEDRVSTAFFKIQDAWCKRDMNLARAFVTDSVLRRFNMQLEEYRQNKTFNRLE